MSNSAMTMYLHLQHSAGKRIQTPQLRNSQCVTVFAGKAVDIIEAQRASKTCYSSNQNQHSDIVLTMTLQNRECQSRLPAALATIMGLTLSIKGGEMELRKRHIDPIMRSSNSRRETEFQVCKKQEESSCLSVGRARKKNRFMRM